MTSNIRVAMPTHVDLTIQGQGFSVSGVSRNNLGPGGRFPPTQPLTLRDAVPGLVSVLGKGSLMRSLHPVIILTLLIAALPATDAIHVDASGNVGIGTDTPAAKLDVAGEIKSSKAGSPDANGEMVYNSTAGRFEFYQGGAVTSIQPLGKVAVVYQRENSGTHGGDASSGCWNIRKVNQENDPDNMVSYDEQNKDDFTISAAGKYRIDWTGPAYAVNKNQTRLVNCTSEDVVVGYGTSAMANDTLTIDISSCSSGSAIVDLDSAGQKFKIEHYCEDGQTNNGLGLAASSGAYEVYTVVTITRFAD
jgi:hypothetical protein